MLGRLAFQQKVSSNDWLLHEDTSSSKIDAYIYSLWSSLPFRSSMYYLCNHHWVCMTQTYFIDDAHCWKIQDFSGANLVLSAMEEDQSQMKCEECIRLRKPCTVLPRKSGSKNKKCDGCTESKLDYLFQPPLVVLSPVVLAKTRTECQKAHQSCVFDTSPWRCSRCYKNAYSSYFAPSR